MFINKKTLIIFGLLMCLNINITGFAASEEPQTITGKYPDYGYVYLGKDKYEKFNRKVFNFNLKLNKYAILPIHTVWASVMPKYGMDRIQSAYTNMEYPKRVISCLIQKDFKDSKTETVRFLTNTTLGLGGLYDPAKKIFKIEPVQEDMEQALCKCRVKPGPYLVFPVLSSCCPRSLVGKLLDTGLNPSSYVGTPILAMVKAGLTVNRTSYMQPLVKMLESTYADPYDIARKLYAIETYIKVSNLDRDNILDEPIELVQDTSEKIAVSEKETDISDTNPEKASEDKIAVSEVIKGGTSTNDIILKDDKLNDTRLLADILLFDYHPQDPVIDAMRTALFDLPEINKSMWAEISLWNRSFSKRVKTSSINIDPSRENYKYRYILQKNKTAPVAIIYPSIGEGIRSYHSVVLAKMFYDAGYSVVIQGSQFQWEFVKSMPKDYRPGLPIKDTEYLRLVTTKILNSLENKYNCQFNGKVVIGTSFGAMTTLFLAAKESEENTLNITKYISINPPIELMYAMRQIDKNTEEWNKNPGDLKQRVAVTASKVIKISDLKDTTNMKLDTLPFSKDEAKLITGFIMHQKLSDLIYTIENGKEVNKPELYQAINNTSYRDYAQKYLLKDDKVSINDIENETSLHVIADYLQHNNNYKIYHTLDDYLVNTRQLKQLKKYCGNNVVLLSNGSHLGFLYRPEFINSLKRDIAD